MERSHVNWHVVLILAPDFHSPWNDDFRHGASDMFFSYLCSISSYHCVVPVWFGHTLDWRRRRINFHFVYSGKSDIKAHRHNVVPNCTLMQTHRQHTDTQKQKKKIIRRGVSCGLRERLSSIKPVLAVAGRLYIIIVAVCGSVHPMMHTDKNRPKQPSKKKKTTKSDRTKWTRKNWHKSWYSVRISWSLPMTDGQTGLDFIPRQVQHVLNSNVLNSMCVCVWFDVKEED